MSPHSEPGEGLRRVIPVTLVTCLFSISSVNAQEPVEPGSRVRIMECTPQCSYMTGTLLGLGQDYSSVVIHFGEDLGPVEVPFDSIEQMEISRGRDVDRMKGVIVGGLAAGGVSFWALKGADAPCDSDAGLFCGFTTAGRIGASLAAAGLGALVGAISAPGEERWELISPSQLLPGGVGGAFAPSIGLAVRFW